MIGWFINCEIFQKYQSPSLASAFVAVVVVGGGGGGGGVIIIIATIAVVVLVVYDNFISERGVGECRVRTGRIGLRTFWFLRVQVAFRNKNDCVLPPVVSTKVVKGCWHFRGCKCKSNLFTHREPVSFYKLVSKVSVRSRSI